MYLWDLRRRFADRLDDLFTTPGYPAKELELGTPDRIRDGGRVPDLVLTADPIAIQGEFHAACDDVGFDRDKREDAARSLFCRGDEP